MFLSACSSLPVPTTALNYLSNPAGSSHILWTCLKTGVLQGGRRAGEDIQRCDRLSEVLTPSRCTVVSSEGKLKTHSCTAASVGMDEATEGPHIFSLAPAQAVDIISDFTIHARLFRACGRVGLCSRVWGRSDCKLGGGGDGWWWCGGGVEVVPRVCKNKDALNRAFPPLE